LTDIMVEVFPDPRTHYVSLLRADVGKHKAPTFKPWRTPCTLHGIGAPECLPTEKWNSDQELWTMAAYNKRMHELPPVVQAALAPKKADAPK